MKRFIPLLLFIAIIFAGNKLYNNYFVESSKPEDSFSYENQTPTISESKTIVESPSITPMNNSNNPSEMVIDKNKTYQAVIKTEEGDITVDLKASETPITVNNFVALSQKGFYNDTVFHRVIKGFMIQGGDPKGDGTGGPGYKFNDEAFSGEYERGTLAMANSGPNTNGSQFFIMHASTPLPKNYVIFGKVSGGLEVVDKIAEAPVKSNPFSGEQSVPVSPVKVTSVEIIEN